MNASASTQNQAFSALLFFYRQVLKMESLNIHGVERARHSRSLPVVFTKAESNAVIGQMQGENRLIVGLLYGSGLRIMEAVRLRVKDLDFAGNEITVRDGKGEQDRLTMLPRALKDPLARKIAAVRRLHEEDLKRGYVPCICRMLWNENTKTQRRILPGNICFPQTSFRLIHVQRKSGGITPRNRMSSER